jgi:hypothetical protein
MRSRVVESFDAEAQLSMQAKLGGPRTRSNRRRHRAERVNVEGARQGHGQVSGAEAPSTVRWHTQAVDVKRQGLLGNSFPQLQHSNSAW